MAINAPHHAVQHLACTLHMLLCKPLQFLPSTANDGLQPELYNCKMPMLTRPSVMYAYADQHPETCRQLEVLHFQLIRHMCIQNGLVAIAGPPRS